MDQARHGTLHHVEVWVPNLDRATATWGWLLGELGYDLFQDWPGGRSWRSGSTYIVFEQSPARTATRHDRCRPGLNHLAFHVESRARADELAAAAAGHGWRLMFADQHPYAGGKGHYAAYLENVDGYEAELVAPGEDELPEPAAAGGKVPASAEPASAGQASAGQASAEPARPASGGTSPGSPAPPDPGRPGPARPGSAGAGADQGDAAGAGPRAGGGAPSASGAPPAP
ncbi:MAG TPA: VOC family protein [Streptosporangiaceae bacterium]|nr:VOC family protein [Streptosporangiaceae bacterium]